MLVRGPEFPKSTSPGLPAEPWLVPSCRERTLKAIENRLAYQALCLNIGKPEVLGSEGLCWLSLELGKRPGCGPVV